MPGLDTAPDQMTPDLAPDQGGDTTPAAAGSGASGAGATGVLTGIPGGLATLAQSFPAGTVVDAATPPSLQITGATNGYAAIVEGVAVAITGGGRLSASAPVPEDVPVAAGYSFVWQFSSGGNPVTVTQTWTVVADDGTVGTVGGIVAASAAPSTGSAVGGNGGMQDGIGDGLGDGMEAGGTGDAAVDWDWVFGPPTLHPQAGASDPFDDPPPALVRASETRHLHVPVAALSSVDGSAQDPTGDKVEFAFLASDPAADDPAWSAGDWVTTTEATPRHFARILVGPGGLALDAGNVGVWVRVTDRPGRPAPLTGVLRVR